MHVSPLTSWMLPLNCGTVCSVSVGCPSTMSRAALLSNTGQICCHTWHGETQMLFQGKHWYILIFQLVLQQPWFKRVWGSLFRVLNYTANSLLQEDVNWLSIMTCFYGRAAAISYFARGGFFRVRGISLRTNAVSTVQGKRTDKENPGRTSNGECLSSEVTIPTAA